MFNGLGNDVGARATLRKSGAEKRTAQRVDLRAAAGTASIGGRPYDVHVLDLSPGGARLSMARGAAVPLGQGELRFDQQIGLGHAIPFEVVRRDLVDGAGSASLQVRFRSPSADDLRAISALVVPRYLDRPTVADDWRPDFVLRGRREACSFLLMSLVAKGRPVRVWHGGRLALDGLLPFKIDWEQGLDLLVCLLPDGANAAVIARELTAPVRVSFSGDLALSYFDVERFSVNGNEISFLIPEVVYQQVSRLNPRLEAPPGLLSVAFDHPRLERLRIEKHPVDLSFNGLSFEVDPQTDMLFVGESIGETIIETSTGTLPLTATIRNARRDGRGSLRYGVELHTQDANQEREWGRLFFDLQHPRVASRPSAFSEANFDLLQRAEYTKKIKGFNRASDRAHYVSTWKRIGERKDLGVFLLYPEGDGSTPLGTVSLNRIFSDLWCVHHLAIDRHHPQFEGDLWRLFEVAAVVYGGAATYMYYTNCPYFRADFKAHHGWNNTIFEKFTDSLQADIEWLFNPYNLYAYSNPVGEHVHGLPQARGIRAHELDVLRARVLKRLPGLETRSHDYACEDLHLTQLSLDYASAGLFRAREILSCGEGDELGFAICEMTDAGINLFGLFNEVRLFLDLVPEEKQVDVAQALAIEAARRYQQRGVARFVLADHELRESFKTGLAVAGFDFVETVWRFITPREIMPYYRSFMNELITAFIRLK